MLHDSKDIAMNFKRGDIVRVNLNFYNNDSVLMGKYRPCIIVSNDTWNEEHSPNYMVLPLGTAKSKEYVQYLMDKGSDMIPIMAAHPSCIVVDQLRKIKKYMIQKKEGEVTNPDILKKLDITMLKMLMSNDMLAVIKSVLPHIFDHTENINDFSFVSTLDEVIDEEEILEADPEPVKKPRKYVSKKSLEYMVSKWSILEKATFMATVRDNQNNLDKVRSKYEFNYSNEDIVSNTIELCIQFNKDPKDYLQVILNNVSEYKSSKMKESNTLTKVTKKPKRKNRLWNDESKLEFISYVEENGNESASEKYNIGVRSISTYVSRFKRELDTLTNPNTEEIE